MTELKLDLMIDETDATDSAALPPASAQAPASGSLSFEQAIEALETMVDALEDDTLPLEQAMQTFERSQALIRHCQQQLTGAEEKVQVLVRQLEADGFGYELESFEDEDDDEDDI